MNTNLPSPGPVALGAAADAEKNVGVKEDPPFSNDGKWIRMYQNAVNPPLPAGSPWCACFVRYRLEAAAKAINHPLPSDFPDSGWCPDYQDWGKQHKLWIPSSSMARCNAQRGDLCLFWFDAKERVAHIGIVVGTWDGGVITVEGNTTDGVTVQREGAVSYTHLTLPTKRIV